MAKPYIFKIILFEEASLAHCFEAFALLAGLPFVGFLVPDDLFLFRIPFDLPAQADRDVGQVTGSHGPVMGVNV